jgi:alkylhydroperoxidase family enzyme
MGTDAGTDSRELTQLREVVRNTAPASAGMEAYLEKVHLHAYRVTDGDVAALKAAGISEDEIFEQTVAAAIAEGLRRLDAAERVL